MIANIEITQGYLTHFLIPFYNNEVRPLIDYTRRACGMVSAGSTFYNYVYGFCISCPSAIHQRDLWDVVHTIKSGAYWRPSMPDDHQRRQFHHHPARGFAKIDSQIINISQVKKCKNFEQLYDYVDSVFKTQRYYNSFLSIYDTACRIGANLSPQILPMKYVYLSAGAYDGAKRLYGKTWITINEDRKFVNRSNKSARIPTSKFRFKFLNIDSAGVEDLLCLFFDLKCKHCH